MSTSAYISTGQAAANSSRGGNGILGSGVPRSAAKCARTVPGPVDNRGDDKLSFKRNRLVATPSGTLASFNFDEKPVVVIKQPTYQLGPKPDRSFSYSTIEGVVRMILNDHLEGVEYDADIGTELTCSLSEAILSQIKRLSIERYKFVCTVMIGEKQRQGVSTTSRCAWDEHHDNYASIVYENSSMYAVANVYGIYSL